MFTITKEFHFSASHVLYGLNDGHPCGRLHGHNYIIKVEAQAKDLDSTSFVQDYGDFKPIGDYINEHMDHRHLNEVIPGQASAENIAKYLFHKFKAQFPLLSGIGVSETPKTWAWYKPDPYQKEIKFDE
jgi:6-pyruvoyltetrahydropterin/6-carboxytetrahydropterin synthase